MELLRPFLEVAHPSEEGWLQLESIEYQGKDVIPYHNPNSEEWKLIVPMNSLYVSPTDLHFSSLLTLKMKAKKKVNWQITLIYGRLVLRPQKLPKGLTVLSFYEESEVPGRPILN